ncbi:MAG TPA: hypothetical protein VD865_10800 [Stenotrophomonas sp.]|nr:hypothetical protein [Stenotrophomonas sp.]
MNLQRTIEVARAAARMGEPGYLSTGEALTAALVLNRHDWLADMGFTVAQAIDRIDTGTVQHLREAELVLRRELSLQGAQT